MFGVKTKVTTNFKRVEKAAERAAYKNFAHAAASIRKDAIESIQVSEGNVVQALFGGGWRVQPSAPGTPPHTGRRRILKRAIRFAADKDGAVIGPMESIAGESGAAHEHGGEFRGQNYPKRPFMAPALERGAERFAGLFEGSIGE